MAIVWQKTVGEKQYEVRQAGNSLRLYTNGIFHSQFNPRENFSGDLWELMCVPFVLAHQKKPLKRVLMLGVGGGAAIKNLQRLGDGLEIVGVDLDDQHLYVAEHVFKVGCESNKVKLVCADAVEWVKNYKGPKFDLILDDLFGEIWDAQTQRCEPRRAISVDSLWLKTLLGLLAESGALIFNMESKREALKLKQEKQLVETFRQQVNFQSPKYENCFSAFYKFEQNTLTIKRSLADHPSFKTLLRHKPDAFLISCGKFPT